MIFLRVFLGCTINEKTWVSSSFSMKSKLKPLTRGCSRHQIENADVLPKASPFIKNIETVQGDGGVGTIKKTIFSDGKYMKNKIDHLDHANCVGKLTLVEGDVLGDQIESISYEVKFEDSKDGGCVVKITTEYHTKGDVVLKEEDIKASKEQSFELYKAYADYLNANPHVCP